MALFKNEGAKLCKSLYHYSQPSYWLDPDFELGDIDMDMQISQTEGNRVNVDVNTNSYTSGKNRRQQLYDRLLHDGVYERVIADRLKALT